MLIFFEATQLYISLAILAITLIGLWMWGKGLIYLFFCMVFGIYLIGVVSAVIFPIHIPEASIPLRFKLQLNLIPFNFGSCDFHCLRNIYENILLTIPFGFGISFITKIKARNMIWLAIAVGLILEITQLVISLTVRSPFRVVDINDVILNAVGILLGYGLFRIFGWLFLSVVPKLGVNRKQIFAYVYDMVNIAE